MDGVWLVGWLEDTPYNASVVYNFFYLLKVYEWMDMCG